MSSCAVAALLVLGLKAHAQDKPAADGSTALPEIVVESAHPHKRKAAAVVRPSSASSHGASSRAIHHGPVQATTSSGTGAPIATSPVPALQAPAGQTVYSQSRDSFSDKPALNVGDLVDQIPGVTFTNGNGPRDQSISIRGSNDHMAFGIRNIQMLEDGFPLVQPDGRARADLIDPHAYASVSAFQGPASTLYGNFAVGGALNLATRTGASINGVEVGSDFGSFGTINNYVTLGFAGKNYDLMLFGSNVLGETSVAHTRYDTPTFNGTLRYNVTPDDRLIFKVINNYVDTQQSARLTLNQFHVNPFQNGCANLLAAGCQSVNLSPTGSSTGPKVAVSPEQAGLHRDDRRTLGGVRWEHDIDNDTMLRTQFTYDQLAIDQPNTATSEAGTFNSFDVRSDITHKSTLFGMSLTSFAAVDFANLQFGDHFHNLTAAGHASLGPLTQTIFGHQTNISGRFQEELQFAHDWKFITGVGVEHSEISAVETNFNSAVAVPAITSQIPADREFFNVAPEAALIYTPSKELTLHARVGTGYGTPQPFSLFTTSTGQFGNNTQLKSQTNVGYDLGADWSPYRSLTLSVTGFYEFFKNEQITQSAGVNLQNFTFNAPASEHRGVEVSALWQPLPFDLPQARVQVSYLYDNQIYTNFNDTITTGSLTGTFNRNGKAIPGVVPQFLDTRLLYDQDTGSLKGLGGFIELVHRDDFFLDNANLIKAPGYDLVNLGVHYDIPGHPGKGSFIRNTHLYFEVDNLFDKTYVGTASNITDVLTAPGQLASASTLASSAGSIFAGNKRGYYGGFRILF